MINVLGQHGAEQSELRQHIGLAVGVGAYIQQDPVVAVLLGQHAGYAGAYDAGYGFDAEDAAHQHGASVARARKGVDLPFLQQVETDADAALGFEAERLGGVVGEGDIVLAGNNIERTGIGAFGFKAASDHRGVADQHQSHVSRKLARGHGGRSNRNDRSVVAAHDVHAYPHRKSRAKMGLIGGLLGGHQLAVVVEVVPYFEGAVAQVCFARGGINGHRGYARFLGAAAAGRAGLGKSSFRIWHGSTDCGSGPLVFQLFQGVPARVGDGFVFHGEFAQCSVRFGIACTLGMHAPGG